MTASEGASEPIELHLPPGYPSDRIAGSGQRESVERFYRKTKFDRLSEHQASNLLDYREFARAVAERLEPELYGEAARDFAEDVAIAISRNRELAESVVTLMRRRFARGADRDGLAKSITRLEFFWRIEQIVTGWGRQTSSQTMLTPPWVSSGY